MKNDKILQKYIEHSAHFNEMGKIFVEHQKEFHDATVKLIEDKGLSAKEIDAIHATMGYCLLTMAIAAEDMAKCTPAIRKYHKANFREGYDFIVKEMNNVRTRISNYVAGISDKSSEYAEKMARKHMNLREKNVVPFSLPDDK